MDLQKKPILLKDFIEAKNNEINEERGYIKPPTTFKTFKKTKKDS